MRQKESGSSSKAASHASGYYIPNEAEDGSRDIESCGILAGTLWELTLRSSLGETRSFDVAEARRRQVEGRPVRGKGTRRRLSESHVGCTSIDEESAFSAAARLHVSFLEACPDSKNSTLKRPAYIISKRGVRSEFHNQEEYTPCNTCVRTTDPMDER